MSISRPQPAEHIRLTGVSHTERLFGPDEVVNPAHRDHAPAGRQLLMGAGASQDIARRRSGEIP